MSRLSIEIDPEQHRQIKTLATFAGMSIKDYILEKTIPSRKAAADITDHLLSSPQNAQRLQSALSIPASENHVFESIEDLQNALGI